MLRTDGKSQRFIREFWDAVFCEEIKVISRANQDSKEDNLWRIDEKYMRYCYYELNYFGDPSIAFIEPKSKGKIKDVLLKRPKHIVIEEYRLARWHWGKFFENEK